MEDVLAGEQDVISPMKFADAVITRVAQQHVRTFNAEAILQPGCSRRWWTTQHTD